MDMTHVLKNFSDRGFQTHYFETAAEATAFMVEQVKGETVGFGGSITAKQLELYDKLKAENTVLWHWETPEDIRAFPRFTTYITSANGVSEEGELVNIDGTGNRLASTLYGPKSLFFIVGKNKLTPNLHTAIHRAQNVAAPLNAKRLNRVTPCVTDLKCHNCTSPQRICRGMTVHMRPLTSFERTVVLFVNEDLGL